MTREEAKKYFWLNELKRAISVIHNFKGKLNIDGI